MKLGVVILNWNAVEDTRRTVLQTKSWRRLPQTPRLTVWVVDNASREPGVESLGVEHPDVRLVTSTVNRGFAGGCNLGIRAAMEDGNDAVLLLNNDASLEESSLASMIATECSDPRIGVVGPVVWDGDRMLSAGGRDVARHLVTHIRPGVLPEQPLDVDYVSGTAAVIRTSTFERVGLLDEEYFFSGEMADLCCRARRSGLRCVTDTRARVSHELERSAGLRDTLHAYYVVRNRFLYVRKHYPHQKARLFALWSARGLYAVGTAVARGRHQRARAILLGLVDGLEGRFGGQNERVLP